MDFNFPGMGESGRTSFVFGETQTSGSLFFYEANGPGGQGNRFVHVTLSRTRELKWSDPFEVVDPAGSGVLGSGRVLHPSVRKPPSGKKEAERRMELLHALSGDESEMLDAITLDKGIKGLTEKETLEFAPLSRKTLIKLSQKLEAKGQIRILSFSPLFLLSQSGFEYLCGKILTFIQLFHEAHADEHGVPIEAVKKKFGLHPRIHSLAVGHLLRDGKILEKDGRLALAGFKAALTPEEESLLLEMEEMCLNGKFLSVSMEDLQKRFHLSARRLENLLLFLTERRKIVKSKDGFFLHSQWLDELAGRIRNAGKTELSVGEFKEMTGLSRKFAIPLLELLDQKGITRRKGPIREILK